MRTISIEEWDKLKSLHCNKGKHRYRTNHFGIAWCTICGTLSNKDFPLVQEDEKLNIAI